MKFIKNNQFTLVSIFLLTLVIILNLNIPMKYKLTLISLGIILCFYQPRFILPFLTSIIVVYLSNRNIGKFKKPVIKKEKDVKEGFFDATSDFFNKIEEVNEFNYSELISNTDINNLKEKKIKITENDRKKVLKTNFLKNCFQLYFFEFPNDYTLALQLNLLYPKINDLKKEFNFTDISYQVGIDDDKYRLNTVRLLKNKTLIKLGLLIHESPYLNIKKYFLKVISDYGLYSILNNKYKLDSEDSNEGGEDNTRYQQIKKNIYELCILFFYLTYRESDKLFNFNQKLELEELSMFKILPEYLENKDLESGEQDKTYTLLNKKINSLNVKLKNNKKLFPTPNLLKIILNGDKNNQKLDSNSSRKILQEKLDLLFNELDDHINDLKLLDISIYRVASKEQRRNQEFKIKGNYFIMLLMTGYCNDLFDLLNSQGNDDISKLANHNKSLYFKKQTRFKLQVQNEITIQQPYNFTGIQDIFYDIFYYYFGLYSKQEQIYTRNFIYPEPEITTPSISPTQSNNSVNILSEYQQTNFELELDPYLDENNLREKQEEALNKYYQFLDKENYEKVRGLNQLAENRNKELKIKELSFNNIIDNFGTEVFKIIDELVLVSKKFYYNNDIIELQSQTNNNLYNPRFQENFESHSPSPASKSNNLSKFDKYILFIKVILDILLRENRIIYTGFIFIMLALLIYFIDASDTTRPETSGVKSIFDLLKL